MNKSRLWLLVVIVLLAVNTAALAMLWWKKDHPAPPVGGGAKDFLVKELQLTAAQQLTYDSMRMDHQSRTRAVMEGMRSLKDALADKLAAADTDTAALEALTRQIHEKERQRDLVTFYHFREFRQILNETQQEKFNGMVREVLRMMNQQRPPGRPGERPGGPGERPPHEGPGGEGPPPQH